VPEHPVILLEVNVYSTIKNRSIGLYRVSCRGKREINGQGNGVVTGRAEGVYKNAVAKTVSAVECATEAGYDVDYFHNVKGIISFIF